jgi:hypothetical protein
MGVLIKEKHLPLFPRLSPVNPLLSIYAGLTSNPPYYICMFDYPVDHHT